MFLTYQVVTAIAACIFAAVWLLARARASSSYLPPPPHKSSQVKNGNGGFDKAWILQEKIGTGRLSKVMRSAKRMPDGTAGHAVAIRCIPKTSELDQGDIDNLREEVAVLKSCEHPNIIKFFDFYEEEETFYVVMEYMEGGDLFDHVGKKTYYNEKEARDVVGKLLDVISYLHRRNIAHGDISPQNFMLKNWTSDVDIKLRRFKFAKQADGRSLEWACGTPGFIAPEILTGKAYGTEVDMWSCGVIVYMLLGGYPPFHDGDNVDNHAVYRKIKAAEYTFEPQYWRGVSADAKDLIRKMIVVDPDKRITAEQALRHPWFLVGDHELITRNLDHTLATMKKFNARRKFRGAVKAIMLANKLARKGFMSQWTQSAEL